MLTPEPDKHIPCFLLDVASVIFKSGSSLHLLQR
jgi:hypothetical protein